MLHPADNWAEVSGEPQQTSGMVVNKNPLQH